MINKECLNLITSLKKYSIITFGELQEQYNVADNNKAFFNAINFLVQYEILKAIV
jgi:hypothetical protein